MANSSSTPWGVTSASFTGLGPRLAVDMAARSQELGYRSYWTAEASGTESFSLLAACGEAAPRLALGTGIIPVQVRSPLLAAMAAATLQALQPDRDILLGVGVSTPTITQRWHGVPYGERPVARVRAYLTLLQKLFDGETVTGNDGFWDLQGASLAVRLKERKPKLVIAALNPRMLSLAGELADGVLLNYLPAAHVAASVAEIRAAEAKAGRDPGSCTIYAYVHVGVADREEARDKARRDVFSYAATEGYGNMMAKAGFADEIAALRAARANGDRAGALAALSDPMIDAIDFIGTPDEVRDYTGTYIAAGVEHGVVMPLPWGQDRRGTIEATLAAVQGF